MIDENAGADVPRDQLPLHVPADVLKEGVLRVVPRVGAVIDRDRADAGVLLAHEGAARRAFDQTLVRQRGQRGIDRVVVGPPELRQGQDAGQARARFQFAAVDQVPQVIAHLAVLGNGFVPLGQGRERDGHTMPSFTPRLSHRQMCQSCHALFTSGRGIGG